MKRTEDMVIGLSGIQHFEDDSREVSRAVWPEHHSKRKQGSPKLTSLNTILHPPLKRSQGVLFFSLIPAYTEASGSSSELLLLFPELE